MVPVDQTVLKRGHISYPARLRVWPNVARAWSLLRRLDVMTYLVPSRTSNHAARLSLILMYVYHTPQPEQAFANRFDYLEVVSSSLACSTTSKMTLSASSLFEMRLRPASPSWVDIDSTETDSTFTPACL